MVGWFWAACALHYSLGGDIIMSFLIAHGAESRPVALPCHLILHHLGIGDVDGDEFVSGVQSRMAMMISAFLRDSGMVH